MAPRGNNMLPNAHFRKHWQRRIKTWFNQPARKQRRRTTRIAKAARLAPRPAGGFLRPVVRCPSIRYNKKCRLGRGFTLEELKRAGMGKNEAQSFGIAVDPRRVNRSVESIERNVARLKEYRSKLIIFPKKMGKPKKGDSSPEELKVAAQMPGLEVMPPVVKQRRLAAEPITETMNKFAAYSHQRRVRADKRLKGKREKKAKEAADEGLGKGR